MECFEIFNSAIKTKSTRIAYTRSMEKFKEYCNLESYCDFKKLTVEELKRFLVGYISTWNNLSYSSCNNYLSAIELFLDMNEIPFPKRIIRKLLPANNKKQGGDMPFTTEEIRRMLSATNKLRTKALIHFFASVGGRPGIITDPVVTIGDLLDMPEGCKGVLLYKGSKEEYWAFLTPEAVNALNNYLKSRKLNYEILDENSPLFTVKGGPMNYGAMSEIFRGLFKQAGIERKKVTAKRFDKATFYGFRKRFNTILKIDNDINSNIAEKLMAHKKGLDGTYLKPTINECFHEFRKAIRELTIDDTERQNMVIISQEKEMRLQDDLKNKLDDQDRKISEQQKQIDDLLKLARLKMSEV